LGLCWRWYWRGAPAAMAEATGGAAAEASGGGGTVRRNILANYVGQAVASVLALALVPVYVRYLGIEAYAIVGLFVVIQAWMALLDLGMTPTLGREMARFTAGTVPVQEIRDLLRSLELVYVGVAVVVGAALTLGAPVLASRWLQVEKLPVELVAQALSLLGIVVALRFCEGIYRGGLMGLQQQVWVNVASTSLALLRTLGALAVLAWVSPTILAFLLWQAAVSLLTLVVLVVRLHTSLPAPPAGSRFSVAALRRIGRFAGGIFSISLLGVVLTQVDKLLLSKLLPLPEFGIFMLASTLVGGLWLLGGPVVLAIGPVLVRHFESGDTAALSQHYHKASQLVAVAVAPATLMLMVFAPGVVFAWSGDAVLAAKTAPILAVLAVGTGINALLQVPYQLQLAAGWTRLAIGINLVAVVVMIPLLLWSVPLYGANAAALVWATINFGYLLATIPLLHRRLLRQEMWRWYGADTALPVLGAAAVVAIGWVLQPEAMANRWLWLGFLAVFGGGAMAAAAVMADTIRPRLLSAVRLG
jgi:O-antigen/teichoic acid export membrane protein